jgi:hypothetical protein
MEEKNSAMEQNKKIREELVSMFLSYFATCCALQLLFTFVVVSV